MSHLDRNFFCSNLAGKLKENLWRVISTNIDDKEEADFEQLSSGK
jgi:hypothetical protein